MWMFAATGVLYFTYQLATGNYKQVTFASSDVREVWPVFRPLLFLRTKPTNQRVIQRTPEARLHDGDFP